MTRFKTLSSHAAAVLIGAIVGALVMFAVDGLTRPDPSRRPAPAERIEVAAMPPESNAKVLLAWSPYDLPRSSEQNLGSTNGVVEVTTVEAGLEWITASRTSAGAVLDDPPKDLAIPWEVAVVDPLGYAPFVAPSERELITGLRQGHGVLSETGARLRGAAPGDEIKLASGSHLIVDGIVSDYSAAGYEALLAGSYPRRWAQIDRFVLMRLRHPSARTRVEHTVDALLDPGEVARIRAQGEVPFLRYGDAVLPQMLIKDVFGEFAARPTANGEIQVDRTWWRQNIRSQRVPLLGHVTCHTRLLPQLRAALRQIIDAGIAFTVNPEQFAGCYSPRFIDRDPNGRLSHHAWGIAVDLNAAENATGTRPDQNDRLVEIFERHGFTWGGRWLVPDGMHFEWVRFP